MADDPTKRGRPDRDRIDIDEEYEVRYWTEKFGVSRVKNVRDHPALRD
jgi:Protein of unknown function (DUF3606)